MRGEEAQKALLILEYLASKSEDKDKVNELGQTIRAHISILEYQNKRFKENKCYCGPYDDSCLICEYRRQ